MLDEAVFQLQEYLRDISLYDEDISPVIPDGIFAGETTASVISFQKKHDITPTGTVDFVTWEKVRSVRNDTLKREGQPMQTAKITNSDLPFKKGDKNEAIHTLHLMLRHLASEYDNFNTLPVKDTFDEDTEEEIKRWQRVISREENGEVDKYTWDMLSEFYLK